jgi:Na+-transporting NADH:ubiquinone oxidoreductase subunit NqrD
VKGLAICSRLARAAVAPAATVLVLAVLAVPAASSGRSEASATKAAPVPSYVIENIVAGGMCLAVLATACKRFRRS